MELVSRPAFALLILTVLTNGAYAGPATNPESESKAIQGEESGPPSKTGPGPTGATNPAMENKAIQGEESGPPSATGAGPSAATNPAKENKEIQGGE